MSWWCRRENTRAHDTHPPPGRRFFETCLPSRPLRHQAGVGLEPEPHRRPCPPSAARFHVLDTRRPPFARSPQDQGHARIGPRDSFRERQSGAGQIQTARRGTGRCHPADSRRDSSRPHRDGDAWSIGAGSPQAGERRRRRPAQGPLPGVHHPRRSRRPSRGPSTKAQLGSNSGGDGFFALIRGGASARHRASEAVACRGPAPPCRGRFYRDTNRGEVPTGPLRFPIR